ncbi:Hypothetical_protein [Hexamita inflata]|uniref:Hypothetical_protein n=1 Tax=Hexamita inflata TaxID=28002 RepID=A0AA86PU52_9EUKA|nr:Hypothetical protein HINF_LOCUS32501 [Hexamita inflata]
MNCSNGKLQQYALQLISYVNLITFVNKTASQLGVKQSKQFTKLEDMAQIGENNWNSDSRLYEAEPSGTMAGRESKSSALLSKRSVNYQSIRWHTLCSVPTKSISQFIVKFAKMSEILVTDEREIFFSITKSGYTKISGVRQNVWVWK